MIITFLINNLQTTIMPTKQFPLELVCSVSLIAVGTTKQTNIINKQPSGSN